MSPLYPIAATLFPKTHGPGHEDDSPLESIRALALMKVMLRAGFPFHRAVASAMGMAGGRLRRALDQALRGVLLGGSPSLEKALEDEVRPFPRDAQWVAGTLREYMLCDSEPETEQRGEHLDRAFDSALESCRQALKEKVSGLRVPVSAIFALGIVLPIVIATMVPLWGMVGSDALTREFHGGAYGSGVEGAEAGAGASYLMATPVLAFPAACLLASLHILRSKEFVSNAASKASVALIAAFFCAMGTLTFILLFVLHLDPPAPLFAAAVIPFIYLLDRRLRDDERTAKEESIYARPSVLNGISAMLGAGEHLVRAVAKASPNSKEASKIFWFYALPRAGIPQGNRGFDDEMVALISEATKRDPRLAATVLRQVSRHLNDLATIEAEVRFELKPIAQSILVTTVLLAPFVLGIAAGFGALSSLAGDGGVSPSCLADLFVSFIAEMVVVGLWLVRRINTGGGPGNKIMEQPAIAAALSLGIFLSSLWLSTAMFA